MRPEDKLSNAIGNIDDKYILEALKYRPRHNTHFMRAAIELDGMDTPTHGLNNVRFTKVAMTALCIIVFITVIAIFSTSNKPIVTNKFIDAGQIQKIEDVKTVQDIQIFSDGDKYYIDEVPIEPGEMLILNTEIQLKQDEISVFYGNVSGDNPCYNIGYIYDGIYNEIAKNVTSLSTSKTIHIDEKGCYYWCITNVSSTKIKFTGSIKTNTQNLLFKDYGDDVIVVDAPCELIIDYYGAEIIEEIYLYNYETNTKTELVKSTHIDFKVNEPGAYIIYAVTKNGIIINLKDYVTIEYGTFLPDLRSRGILSAF